MSTRPLIFSRKRRNTNTSVIRDVTVSSFSMTLVSHLDNPGQYVLFQLGRSVHGCGQSALLDACNLWKLVLVFISYKKIMGLRPTENVQPLWDISWHAPSGVLRWSGSPRSTCQLHWWLALGPCNSHSISWGLSFLNWNWEDSIQYENNINSNNNSWHLLSVFPRALDGFPHVILTTALGGRS